MWTDAQRARVQIAQKALDIPRKEFWAGSELEDLLGDKGNHRELHRIDVLEIVVASASKRPGNRFSKRRPQIKVVIDELFQIAMLRSTNRPLMNYSRPIGRQCRRATDGRGEGQCPRYFLRRNNGARTVELGARSVCASMRRGFLFQRSFAMTL